MFASDTVALTFQDQKNGVIMQKTTCMAKKRHDSISSERMGVPHNPHYVLPRLQQKSSYTLTFVVDTHAVVALSHATFIFRYLLCHGPPRSLGLVVNSTTGLAFL
jgi:hypothetical protein